MKQTVLIIDDETGIRESLSVILEMEGYEVECAESAHSGLRLIDEGKNYDFIVCDIRMPGVDGIGFLEEVRNRDLGSILIMISAYGTVETSIDAIKHGAHDYISKPINGDELTLRMRMAWEREKLRKENLFLRRELGKDVEVDKIVFVSEGMRRVVDFIKKVSEYKTTVLITGESGTGKELVARAIHNGSSRKDKPFVAVNCAAIPESLLESELFGYVKGAFTGANATRRGLFEEAHGGTLFLDEIGELHYALQAKLLRVLEEKEIRRLGNTKTIKVDVRIIAATCRDLAQDVKGGFREDLFYRLNVLSIQIPPLRDRTEDIPHLAGCFIKKYNLKLNCRVKEVSNKVMSELLAYSWPGNVRELENIVERAMILTDSETIDGIELGLKEDVLGSDYKFDSLSLEEAYRKLEKDFIEKALLKSGGNRKKASEFLGVSLRSLFYKLKQHGYSEE